MLSIYLGCMYAGKTKTLCSLFVKTQDAIVFDYTTNESTTLYAHDNTSVPCIKVIDLYMPKESTIFINEAQFFKNLKPFVLEALSLGKNIYLFGLDGDFKQNKFGDILDLIPYCDTVTKLHAICTCGNPAIFSYRCSSSKEQYLPHDSYVPLCRSCYTARFKQESDI